MGNYKKRHWYLSLLPYFDYVLSVDTVNVFAFNSQIKIQFLIPNNADLMIWQTAMALKTHHSSEGNFPVVQSNIVMNAQTLSGCNARRLLKLFFA